MLVFPSGAKVNDKSGLLRGEYKDGRRITIFKDLEDVRSKEKLLQTALTIDPEKDPSVRLVTLVQQRRARALLDHIDTMFTK